MHIHLRVRSVLSFQGMLLHICGPNGSSRQEFLVKKSTESAKCGRKGIIFHLDVETILIKFEDEALGRKLTQSVGSIRYHLAPVTQENCLLTPLSCSQEWFQGVGVPGPHRGLVCNAVFSILRIPLPTTKHDAGLHPDVDLPTGNPI